MGTHCLHPPFLQFYLVLLKVVLLQLQPVRHKLP